MSLFRKLRHKIENENRLKKVVIGQVFNYSEKDKTVYGAMTCINNDPDKKEMFVKTEFLNIYFDDDDNKIEGVYTKSEVIPYSDVRLKHFSLINYAKKITPQTLEHILRSEIKVCEQKENYEKAAILKETINKLSTLK